MAFPEIQFGTDGWRARLGEGFTTDRVIAVVDALADTDQMRNARRLEQPLLVAYDARFLAEAFARLAAARLADAGFKVLLANAPTATPGICASIVKHGGAAGIMLTASHNPPEYLGIKIKGSYGGSATAKQIGLLVTELAKQPRSSPERLVLFPSELSGNVNLIDMNAEHLAKLLDYVVPSKNKAAIVHDAMFGSGKGLLAAALQGKGSQVVPVRHDHNPGFAGLGPEPLPERLEPMFKAVRRSKAALGIATDGDADRVAACDAAGNYVYPYEICALLIDHLSRRMKKKGAVVRNLATSELVRKVAEDRKLEVVTTPVGFKHIVEQMFKGKVLIGGEESGGIAIPEYLPERDGILCGLLLREIIIQNKKPLRQLLDELYRRYGPSYYQRQDLHIAERSKAAILEALNRRPPENFGKDKVLRLERLDGFKFWLADDAWLLVRASGTEPILRVYTEGRDRKHVAALQSAFTTWLMAISPDTL